MKFAMLLFALTVPVWAASASDADYPVQYVVTTASKVGSLMIGNFCTMSVRDQAAPSMAFVVQRRGHGGCHIMDSGAVLHGRREKNSLKLLTTDDKGKVKAEDWPITGTVALGWPASQ